MDLSSKMASLQCFIPIGGAVELCGALCLEYPNSTVFSGKLIFARDRLSQRRLQRESIATVILPIRVR
jgi:hypothetical protein